MRVIIATLVLLVSANANAVPMSVGDIARVDFQTSDWSFGSGDPQLRAIGPRIGFCGTLAGGTGAFSGNAACDLSAGDSFRMSIFSASDALLFTALDPVNGGVSPNTWQNNISIAAPFFPRSGYLLIEIVAGAFDLNQIFLLGIEATPPAFSVQTPLLSFTVTQANGGGGGNTTPVPEPSALALLLLGFALLGFARRPSPELVIA